jgi:phosphatidylserine/phosphatidylglycerophosphate/cardiolipin synthase-like enzyme
MMYFDDDCPQTIFAAINSAAANGIKMRIIASSTQESSVVLEKLKQAVDSGNFQMVIEPSESSATMPFIHTKTYISDAKKVLLGSMNMSYASLMKNREVDLETDDTTVVANIQGDFDADWEVFYSNDACAFIPPKP